MNCDDFFESLEQQFKNESPFVVYRKPDDNTIKAMLQQDSELFTITDFKESGFVFAPFEDKEDAVLIPLEKSELISIENFISELSAIPAPDSYREAGISSKDNKKDHINLVQKGIEAIEVNQFQKVVLSRQEIIRISETNPISIFKGLLSKYKSAFVYCWFHPKVGLWLGATPETLLRIKDNRFYTMALAGTQQYEETIDVHWDNKNIEEQQLVSNFIMDKLKEVAADLSISEVKTIKAGSLLHLRSDISGTIKQETNNLKRLINILHPTPAVCGLPKNNAKQFILKNENYNREFYTGFLGEFEANNSTLYVNLRCMQLKNHEAILYIGGGITKDSIPENEWEETLNKAKIMKRVL
ncbi:MAG: chorismate-binding protein [Flavobacteriaceae bacterium]|nr:chorismate-binding protein [Flavobacteriaceae bacterium]